MMMILAKLLQTLPNRLWKIKHPLIKTGIPAQPLLCLALDKTTFNATGEYEVTLNDFEKKPVTDCTFPNFCTFNSKECRYHIKQDKSSTKSMGLALQTAPKSKQMYNRNPHEQNRPNHQQRAGCKQHLTARTTTHQNKQQHQNYNNDWGRGGCRTDNIII